MDKPVLFDATGKPARSEADLRCPQCGARPDQRRLSSGFGVPHDVCGACGHDFFDERTAAHA